MSSFRWPFLIVLLAGWLVPSVHASTVPDGNGFSLIVLGSTPKALTRIGDTVRLEFTVGRGGEATGRAPVFEVQLPNELLFEGANVFQGDALSCQTPPVGSSGLIRCPMPEEGSGTVSWVEVNTRIAPTAQAGSVVSTRGTVSAAGGGDNTRTVDLETVVQSGSERADMRIRIEADPAVTAPGETLVMRMVVENLGPDMAAWPSFQFRTPESQALGSASPLALSAFDPSRFTSEQEGWSCAIPPTVGLPPTPPRPLSRTCSITTMAPGEIAVFSYDGTVSSNITGPVKLAATLFAQTADPNPTNHTNVERLVPFGSSLSAVVSIPASQPLLLAVLAAMTLLLAGIALRRR